jgi:hypothetical protein
MLDLLYPTVWASIVFALRRKFLCLLVLLVTALIVSLLLFLIVKFVFNLKTSSMKIVWLLLEHFILVCILIHIWRWHLSSGDWLIKWWWGVFIDFFFRNLLLNFKVYLGRHIQTIWCRFDAAELTSGRFVCVINVRLSLFDLILQLVYLDLAFDFNVWIYCLIFFRNLLMLHFQYHILGFSLI